MDQVIETEGASVTRAGRPRQNSSGGSHAPTKGIVLGPRDRLSGELHIDGDIRIQGSVEGQIHAGGDIEVEHSGRVEADLDGGSVTVQGSVAGNVVARRRLLVAGSGRVSGDVRTPKLQVDDGATVNGTITMNGTGPVSDDGE